MGTSFLGAEMGHGAAQGRPTTPGCHPGRACPRHAAVNGRRAADCRGDEVRGAVEEAEFELLKVTTASRAC